MAKKVAVLAVNPVNGCGLFQYLETFFENGISYKVFAVSNTKEIRTNSGIALIADDVIANLKGHELLALKNKGKKKRSEDFFRSFTSCPIRVYEKDSKVITS